MSERFSGIKWLVRQRAFHVAIVLWLLLCGAGLLISRHTPSYRGLVVGSSRYLVLVVLMFGLVMLLTRKRPVPDLAQRAPESSIARRETLVMWAYVAVVMVAGRLIGQHFFGEGIAMHLNGSLLGATRVQSPIEVYTWAAYNGILLALISVSCVSDARIFQPATQLEIGELEERCAGHHRGPCLQRRDRHDGPKYISAHAASAACRRPDVLLVPSVRNGSPGHDRYLLHLDAQILQAVLADDGVSAGSGKLPDNPYF
jgi:hypothetical protein